jgi:integral membrane protein
MTPAPASASVDVASAVEAEGAAPAAGISPVGRVFAVIALLEAFTWAGLLVGMFLKYVTGTTEAGVWLFGRLHGGVFMLYVVMTLVAAVALRWRWWVALLALLASIPPLVTVPLEIWLRRTGRLVRRPRG